MLYEIVLYNINAFFLKKKLQSKKLSLEKKLLTNINMYEQCSLYTLYIYNLKYHSLINLSVELKHKNNRLNIRNETLVL